MKIFENHQAGYESLCAAVIGRAIIDYERSIKYHHRFKTQLEKSNDARERRIIANKIKDCENFKSEIEDFFCNGDSDRFMDADGKAVLKTVQNKLEKEVYEIWH